MYIMVVEILYVSTNLFAYLELSFVVIIGVNFIIFFREIGVSLVEGYLIRSWV